MVHAHGQLKIGYAVNHSIDRRQSSVIGGSLRCSSAWRIALLCNLRTNPIQL
jgi:hypothetical protein